MKCKAEGCENKVGVTPSGRCNTGGYCRTCINCINNYGVNSVQRQVIYDNQSDKCAICKTDVVFVKPSKGGSGYSACLDHDHKTKKIRGILCSSCNLGLGRFKDNIDFLKQAVLYLEDHK